MCFNRGGLTSLKEVWVDQPDVAHYRYHSSELPGPDRVIGPSSQVPLTQTVKSTADPPPANKIIVGVCVISSGSRKLTCITPATWLGAGPAYNTVTKPGPKTPIVCCSIGNCPDKSEPSGGGGTSVPKPVPNTETILPGAALLVELLMLPSSLVRQQRADSD